MAVACASSVNAGGGYFSLGYGPIARQTAGAVTAVAEDAFAGASNPGKLTAVGNRFEMGLELFNPHRKIKRSGATGSGEVYNFSSNSRNSLFVIPEFAYARRINDRLAIGLTAYANGGLNGEFHDTTNPAGTNANPEMCGMKPGNFLLGCGALGFDLSQFIIAPTVAWSFAPGQSIGISPLIALQRFEAYGFQALAPASKFPDRVSNNGYDYAFGGGIRIGWHGEFKPWLSLGAAYSSKIYMEDFDKYKGLFAEGSFDIPANYSLGMAVKPGANWLLAVDIQRIDFGKVNALSNGVTNTLLDADSPLGSDSGSGFGWRRNQTNYRLGLSYRANTQLTLRAGFAYGKRPNNNEINAVSLSILTPNSLRQISAGFSWKTAEHGEFHMAVSRFLVNRYRGPSALFPGANDSVSPYVNTLSGAWTRHL